MASKLPVSFNDFEPFSGWALRQRDARYKKRIHSSMEEIRWFYDALRPRIAEAVQYLDARPLNALSEEESRLLWLTLAWIEASRAVEVIGGSDVRYGLDSDRFTVQDVATL